MHIVAAHKPAADDDKRTISGLVLPYGRAGYTSAGAVTVNAGAVTIPEDLSRVKLLRDHSTEDGFTPVGYATAAESTEDGLRMSFKIGRTADGDTALADVTEHIRDALSVELINTSVTEDGQLTAGELTAVALVPIPAFADARVDLITAALTDEQADDQADSEDAEQDDTDDTENTDETPTDTEDTAEDGDSVHQEGENDTETQQEDTMNAAHAPAGIHAAKPKHIDFDGAVRAISDLAAGRRTPELTAALKDITYSTQTATRVPQWLGHLWEGGTYTREIVPTLTPKPLTGVEAIGWRWKKRPEVNDYAGDKKEIPTNTAETETIKSKAKRLAAGWDFDRAYYDFNDTEFIKEFFEAAREDYAMKTDDRAAKAVVEYATNESELEAKAQPDLLRAAAHARQLIKQVARVEASTYLVNPDDMFDLLDITTMDMPQYLKLLGVEPEKFVSSPLAPAGSVIAYAKQAVRWYELGNTPIRVNAQHISHGGVDEALFGYYDTMLVNPRGIVAVPIAESAGTVEAGA
ncbi:hypothetical protein CIG21_01705 [Corynebacterium hadale]|uniref:Phage major capsid protein n=2 Tax=Corynebacteriaceae TaxID=1653 RepID=A0A269PHN1_9CORY|nr:hypothetical protein CIG21_01705 [Corynebacterium hadale]